MMSALKFASGALALARHPLRRLARLAARRAWDALVWAAILGGVAAMAYVEWWTLP